MDTSSQLFKSLSDPSEDQQSSMLPGLRLISERRQEAAASHIDHQQQGTSHDSEAAAPSIPKPGKKICTYWYHGNCTNPSSECKFLHQTEGSSNTISWQLRRRHGPPCGLEFCPFKESIAPKAKETVPDASQDAAPTGAKANKTKKRKRKDSVVAADTEKKVKTNDHCKKEQIAFRHPDHPYAEKQQEIDYDDVSQNGDDLSQQTCFFWYHGECGRANRALRGIGPPCPFRHELTEPPSIELPPPGYHAHESCGREWCVFKSASPAPVHKESENNVKRSASFKSKQKAVDETCFFWYHGHCARASDRGGCCFKHELTDPPSFVQPPPGYIHRQPCGLDWCPGDAREGHSLRTAILGQDPVVSRTGESSAADVNDWFLNGFD